MRKKNIETITLQDKLDKILNHLPANDRDLSTGLGYPLSETKTLLELLERENRAYCTPIGVWRASN